MNRGDRPTMADVGRGFGRAFAGVVHRLLEVLTNRRLAPWINGSAAAGEVLIFLPVAILVVAILHEAAGPAPTLVGLFATYALVRRPSIRALAWTIGGLYVSWGLLELGSRLASQPPDPVAEPARSVVALTLSAGGLGAFLLTFGLPVVRAAARWLPEQTQVATIWSIELGRGGLAGASIGAGLASLLPANGPFSIDESSGRVLVIGLVTAIGIVAGGLRADGRVRVGAGAAHIPGQEARAIDPRVP